MEILGIIFFVGLIWMLARAVSKKREHSLSMAKESMPAPDIIFELGREEQVWIDRRNRRIGFINFGAYIDTYVRGGDSIYQGLPDRMLLNHFFKFDDVKRIHMTDVKLSPDKDGFEIFAVDFVFSGDALRVNAGFLTKANLRSAAQDICDELGLKLEEKW